MSYQPPAGPPPSGPPPSGPNPYGQPGYGQPAQDPGRTLGIVGLILAFICSLVGLILSIVAYTRSKNAGFKNNIALAGIIVAVVLMVLSLILNFTGVFRNIMVNQ